MDKVSHLLMVEERRKERGRKTFGLLHILEKIKGSVRCLEKMRELIFWEERKSCDVLVLWTMIK